MNAASLKGILLRAHAKAPSSVAFGNPTAATDGPLKKEHELSQFQSAVEMDNNPELDQLDLKGLVVPSYDPSSLMEFSGTSQNGFLLGHTGNGARVGQRIFTPESIEKIFIRDEADGLEVKLSHIDRATPEKSTEENFFLKPSAGGSWELQVPLTERGEELSWGDLPDKSSSRLGEDARIVRQDKVWLLVGDAPF
jgi:hypothetical protein